MNNLQIILLVIGLLLIAAVLLYNWWQDRQAQKRLSRHFGYGDTDPLLNEEVETEQYPELHEYTNEKQPNKKPEKSIFGVIKDKFEKGATESKPKSTVKSEPSFKQATTNTDESEQVTSSEAFDTQVEEQNEGTSSELEIGPDPMTEAVIDLRFGQAIPGSFIAEQTARFPSVDDKAIRYFFVTEQGQIEVDLHSKQRYTMLQMTVVLANRTGPLNNVHWSKAMMVADELASQFDADIEAPRQREVEKQAKELDNLCAQLDAQVGISLLLQEAKTAQELDAIAREKGFTEYRQTLAWCNDQGLAHFVMLFENAIIASFQADEPVQMINLLIDVPNSSPSNNAFSQMVEIAQDLAVSIQAQIVDDHQQAIEDEQIIQVVDKQLAQMYQELEEQGLDAGSDRSLRVFS